MKKKLYVSQVEDLYMQQNMKALSDVFNTNPFLKGHWHMIKLTIPNSGTAIKYEHNLDFTPSDVIITSVINGTITMRYAEFDGKFIVFDATVTSSTPQLPLTVRVLIGRYTEDTIGV